MLVVLGRVLSEIGGYFSMLLVCMARVYGRYSPDINISDGLLRGIVQPDLVSVLHSLARVSVGILQHLDQEVLQCGHTM